MRIYNQLSQKLPQNLFEAALILVVASLPFSLLKFSNISIILLGVCWLVSKKNFRQGHSSKILLAFALFYFLHIIGLLYSIDIASGLSDLERKLSIILLPLFILSKATINRKVFPYILGTFVLSTLANAAYSITRVLLLSEEHWKEYVGYTGKDYRLAFSYFSDIHPTYFSIFLYVSVFIIFYFIYKNRDQLSKILLGSFIALSMIFIALLLASRTPSVIFFILLLIGALVYSYKRKSLIKGVSLLLISLAIFGSIGYNTDSIRYRFEEFKNADFSPPTGINHTSTNIRVALLLCSVEVSKKFWLFGAGTGDAQHELSQCYKDNKYSDILYTGNYNPHNQYLETLISLGIIGLILFLMLNLLLLRYAWQKGNFLHLFFIVYILICCLTESMLEVNKGIVLYSFFHAILTRMSAQSSTST